MELASSDAEPASSEILDHGTTLTFWQNDIPIWYVNGIVTQLKQGETRFERTRYGMVIEPELIRASYQSDNKIFQQQNTEQIIRTLLQKNHINRSEFHLTTPFWQREYCVQYRETNAVKFM
ncbi:contractile injection system protein, VgrG/Pvc8 family [Pasteurellaceae bacterium LIM206]|nr:contractile injection system protein, VgrG/Pvc8 family [Pasteurellaceae bacterium LIM206]